MLKKLFALTLVILVAGAAVVAYLGPTAAFGLVIQAYGDYQYEQMKNEEPYDGLGSTHPANNHSTNPDWVAYEHSDVENLWAGDNGPHYELQRVLYQNDFNVGHDSFLMDTVARGVAADAGQNGVTETVVNESWVAPADVPGECVGRSLVYTTEVVVVNDTIQYRYFDDIAEIIHTRMVNDTAVQEFTAEPVEGGVGVWAEFEETGEAGLKGQYYVGITVCDDESQ
jgi:hypothetical protein